MLVEEKIKFIQGRISGKSFTPSEQQEGRASGGHTSSSAAELQAG